MNNQEQTQKSPLELAIGTLIEAAEVAREKGAFTFPQASIINQAILFFTTPQAAPEVTEEEELPETIAAPKKKGK